MPGQLDAAVCTAVRQSTFVVRVPTRAAKHKGRGAKVGALWLPPHGEVGGPEAPLVAPVHGLAVSGSSDLL